MMNKTTLATFRIWIISHSSILALISIIILGGVLRLYQYLANRSLWYDEALLAINIINRSFLELARPLDYSQGAPIGFLWVEKAITLFLGTNELALRIFPLLGGLLALLMFCLIACKILNTKASIIALILFAISDPLIYYSSEVKQYSTDVLATLIALVILIPLLNGNLTYWRALLYGLLGATLIWLSHPVIFVLAAFGVISFTPTFLSHKLREKKPLVFMIIIWASSFLSLYIISLSQLTQNQKLLDYWDQGFAPPIINVTALIAWLVESFC